MILRAITTAALIAAGTQAAAAEFITNGGFEQLGPNGAGQFNYSQPVGWSTPDSGYNFVFAPGTGDTTGSYTPTYNGFVSFYGPLPATSPAGGNFVAMDGAFNTATGDSPQGTAITQTLTGLTAGQSYTVSFYWAAAQQQGFSGDTTDQIVVSLGGISQSTSVVNNPSQGFTEWMQESFSFVAGDATQELSFLAIGTPTGRPPFALLDGVSVMGPGAGGVPEAATWAMMIAGFGLVGVAARRRSAAVAA